MIQKKHIVKVTVFTSVLLLLVVMASAFITTGCTERLEGEFTPNQKPVVHFVNIPPDGARFSRNPAIYWWGTDTDALIDQAGEIVGTEQNVQLAKVRADHRK